LTSGHFRAYKSAGDCLTKISTPIRNQHTYPSHGKDEHTYLLDFPIADSKSASEERTELRKRYIKRVQQLATRPCTEPPD